MIHQQFFGSAKNVTITADYHLQAIHRYQVITIGDANQYSVFLPSTTPQMIGGVNFHLTVLSGGSVILKNHSGSAIPFLKYNGAPAFDGVIVPLDGSWESNAARLLIVLGQLGGWLAFPNNSS